MSLVDAQQRTMLFLIADTGAGHRSAANAIRNAIKLISQQEQTEWLARHSGDMLALVSLSAHGVRELPPPTYRIEIVDVFEEYSRFPLREVVKLYGPTIRYNPRLYSELFRSTNREKMAVAFNSVTAPLIFNGLLRLLTTVQPDIVVSIHPMLNFITVRVLRKLGLNIPFITVVTDLVSVHRFWFVPGVDACIVPTEQAKQLCLQRGLDAKCVHMLGMPIDPAFAAPVDHKDALRQKLGLKPNLPVVLLVGGGDGAGGLLAAVRAISRAHLPVQLLVVTGRNKRLYASLQRMHAKLHVPAHVFGFVQNMPEMMRASDVIVTKAGPGTISEALACHLPIVLSGYVPGQEEGNVDYVVDSGMGMLALNARTLIDSLRRLLKPGSSTLVRCLENAQRISRPSASFDIARCLLSFLPALGEEGCWTSDYWQYQRRKMTVRLRSAMRIRPLPRVLAMRLRSVMHIHRPLPNMLPMRLRSAMRIRPLPRVLPMRLQSVMHIHRPLPNMLPMRLRSAMRIRRSLRQGRISVWLLRRSVMRRFPLLRPRTRDLSQHLPQSADQNH
jgi:1,2-diacylglycerol 3-beta-galactosyltransferase